MTKSMLDLCHKILLTSLVMAFDTKGKESRENNHCIEEKDTKLNVHDIQKPFFPYNVKSVEFHIEYIGITCTNQGRIFM